MPKFIKDLFRSIKSSYQIQIENYLSQKNITNPADADFWIREYFNNTNKGFK